MGASTNAKKKTNTEIIKELKAALDKALDDNKILSKFAMDELDDTVQYRESGSVLRLMAGKAKQDGFTSVNKWVRFLGRKAVGIDSKPE